MRAATRARAHDRPSRRRERASGESTRDSGDAVASGLERQHRVPRGSGADDRQPQTRASRNGSRRATGIEEGLHILGSRGDDTTTISRRVDGDRIRHHRNLVDALNDKFKAPRSQPRSLPALLWALQWRQIRGWLGLAVLVLVLAACARFHPEPALDFPPWPHLTFQARLGGGACLDEPDAQALLRWLDKLRAFEAARQRLLK